MTRFQAKIRNCQSKIDFVYIQSEKINAIISAETGRGTPEK